MNILILNGSPNQEKGATGSIIEALEKGLLKKSQEITKKHIYKLNVNPCQGCFSCWTHTPGKCIHKDDMETILPLVAESDILILATPVYVDGMTGPMKTLLDRLITLLKGRVELRDNHMRHVPRENMKKGKLVLVSPSGFAEMDTFDPLVSHVKAIAKNIDRVYAGEILVPNFWYLQYSENALERALKKIACAGEELVEKGLIPSSVSEELGSLVSRDEIIKAMNTYYGKYE